LNGKLILQAAELYNYRSFFQTILTYGSDDAASQTRSGISTTVTYCPAILPLPMQSTSFTRWNRIKQSKEVELYGRIHSDICNVGQNLISGVQLQIKFTKARFSSYFMHKDAESKTFFK